MENKLQPTANQRITEVLKSMKQNSLIQSYAEVCQVCGVSRQYITDVQSKGIRYSIKFIKALLVNYPYINGDYIRKGKQPMFNNDISPEISDMEKSLKKAVDYFITEIERKNAEIAELKRRVEELESK